MNKLILGTLCVAGIALNGFLTSRNFCLEALASIDDKVAEAKSTYQPRSGWSLQQHLDNELQWFIWHNDQKMLFANHRETFNTAVHAAINKACK